MIRILPVCFLLFTVGCASVPIRHNIDPVDLSLMNKVALLVLETKTKAVKEGFLFFNKRNFYDSPIEWYCRENTPKTNPVSKTIGSVGNVDVEASIGVAIILYDPSTVYIDKKETEQLAEYFKDTDIKQKFLDKLTLKLKEVKEFEFLPRDVITNLHNEVYGKLEKEDINKFLEAEKAFEEELVKHTDADTFMVFYIGPWGFQRRLSFNFKKRKGDFAFIASGKIIRLNDRKTIWERKIVADLSEGKKWKDLPDVRDILASPKDGALIEIDNMISKGIDIIIEDFHDSSAVSQTISP